MEYLQTIACILLYGAAGALLPKLIRPVILRKLEKRGKEMTASVQDKAAFKIGLILLAAALGGVTGYFAGPLTAAFIGILTAFSLAFAMIDMRIHVIPNEMILMIMPLGLLFQLYEFGWLGALKALGCMAALIVIFMVLGMIFGLEKMGAGDVKLMGAMGLVLGFPLSVYGIFIMSVTLVGFSLVGMAMGRMTHVSMIPLAPFMMLGQISSLILMVLPLGVV
jgi:prepilin signal peptidase PulO-like enzyme (type II secretory pathway)